MCNRQNVCSPETRGTAFAFFNLSDDLGKGGGPMVIASFVKVFGSRRYSSSTRYVYIPLNNNTLMTRTAFNVASCFWILCGLALGFISTTIVQDEAAVQDRVRTALLLLAEREVPPSHSADGDDVERHDLPLDKLMSRTASLTPPPSNTANANHKLMFPNAIEYDTTYNVLRNHEIEETKIPSGIVS